MKKILCVIMHGINCQDRYTNVDETWGKDIDSVYYSDYEDTKKKILKTTDDTSYQGLEYKLINSFKKIHEIYNDYDWFLFCDDDTFVNVKLLYDEINNFDENYVYGKVLYHGWKDDPNLIFCSGGGGTLISRKIFDKLLINLKSNNLGCAADVSLAINLKNINVGIKNSNFFNSDEPKSLNISEDEYKNYITFHNIRTKDMMEKIYKKVNY